MSDSFVFLSLSWLQVDISWPLPPGVAAEEIDWLTTTAPTMTTTAPTTTAVAAAALSSLPPPPPTPPSFHDGFDDDPFAAAPTMAPTAAPTIVTPDGGNPDDGHGDFNGSRALAPLTLPAATGIVDDFFPPTTPTSAAAEISATPFPPLASPAASAVSDPFGDIAGFVTVPSTPLTAAGPAPVVLSPQEAYDLFSPSSIHPFFHSI